MPAPPPRAVRLVAPFRDHSLHEITPALGRRNRHSTDKARQILGWTPRPAEQTVLDCARSLPAHNALSHAPGPVVPGTVVPEVVIA